MTTIESQTIGASCEVGDGTHSKIPREESGVLYLTCRNFKEGRVDYSNVYFISEENFGKYFKSGKKALICPRPGDLVFSIIGTIGEPYLVRPTDRFGISSSVAIVRPKPENIDPKFLYYWMRSPRFQGELFAIKGGVAQGYVSLAMIKSLPAPTLPISTQRKIAGILSAYDDLIENNLRRIKILEEMAQSLYREWFVYFRFPGHESVRFNDSEFGQIPKGWEVKKLKEVCVLTMGQSPKSEYYNDRGEGTPFHQGVTNFGDYFPTDRLYSTEENRIAEEGDILFSVRAPVGRINVANKRIVIGRGVSAIRECNCHQDFLLFQLKHLFQEEDSMGNGAIFKAVTKADMEDIKLLLPKESWIERFEKASSPIFSNLKNLTQRNRILRRTRDILLPKLIA